MSTIREWIDNARAFFTQGHARSIKIKKHIGASMVIKGLSILVSFLLVPLTIGYVDEMQYGLWITISSVVGWFSFFDIGLGKGLRNKFAEALAKGETQLAREYVSTTYAIMIAIAGGLLFLFYTANFFLDWEYLLNAPEGTGQSLSIVALIVFSFFCLNFVLKLIHVVVTADQRPALVGAMNLAANVIALGIIFILTQVTEGSLVYLAWALTAAPLLILVVGTLWFFARDYQAYMPSFSHINFDHFQVLISLGVKFFLIQVIQIIIFSTDNLIISHLYDPAEVTPYTVAYKYFGIITRVSAIICLPFWSAYTEAYVKGDTDWIIRTNKKLIRIWQVMSVGGLGMLAVSELFYRIWVPMVEVPFLLSCFMYVFVVIFAYGNIFVMFINGVGKVKLQMAFSIFGGILNIPLSILFAKHLGMGTSGVIFASTICMLFGALLGPIQFKKIISRTATGIWNK